MLAKGLAARGMRVALLVAGDRSALPREAGGVDVIAQPLPPRVRFLGGLLHDFNTLRAMLCTRARVIVTRTGGRSVAVAALAARLRRTGFVFSSANVVDFDLERIDRRHNVRLFGWGARRADRIVVQTEEQVELCRRRFGRDPVVIRSIAERAEPRQATREAFLWIGRLVGYKRLDVYLDLAADVPEAHFRAIAVPGQDEQPELRAHLERCDLPNLEVLEPRPRAELAPLMDSAVAIVGTGQYEGMPNVLLEGWARGVPALVFSHDPDGIVERDGLGGFAAGSRERLAELARAQWTARGDEHEVAERCIAYVAREHDLDAVCTAWRRVLTGIGA
jgi:glycosyltransferase involved in cell wall biosynthesis